MIVLIHDECRLLFTILLLQKRLHGLNHRKKSWRFCWFSKTNGLVKENSYRSIEHRAWSYSAFISMDINQEQIYGLITTYCRAYSITDQDCHSMYQYNLMMLHLIIDDIKCNCMFSYCWIKNILSPICMNWIKRCEKMKNCWS